MSIKAVIFDIDGTFYPNWRMNIKTLPVVLKNLRLFTVFNSVRKELRKKPDMEVKDFYKIQAEMAAEKLGKPVKDVQKKIERDIYIEWTQSLKKVKPYNHVREVIEELHTRGYKTACLSDFPILDKLRYFNLHDLFENSAYTCEECGHLKPHPDAYKFVKDKVLVEPHEILYVGNSYPYDIVGAKKAGMYAAHISKKKINGEFVADFTFSDYKDFIDKFNKFIEGK
ncbi:MAG: HAD family hydrolase [Spirochaetales bacterium]|nr:HAD family hydrolase [Spirochaetales bacterium]